MKSFDGRDANANDPIGVARNEGKTMIEYKGCTISIQAVLTGGVYKDPTYAISRDGEFIHHGMQRGHFAVLEAAKSAAEKSACTLIDRNGPFVP